MTSPATTPAPPYYAVIFTSRRNEQPGDGYAETADRMFELVQEQPGFLGFDTARADGFGITVCYFDSEEHIAAWKAQSDHLDAQREGRARWYDAYELRVARVERAYGFERS
jgi:heme-degrading monooxygenase HmoA